MKAGDIPCKGNRTTLGLTSGNINFGLSKKGDSSTNQYLGANTSSYGQNINHSESISWNTSTTTGVSIGITTDSSKSGIIADTSSLTISCQWLIKY